LINFYALLNLFSGRLIVKIATAQLGVVYRRDS